MKRILTSILTVALIFCLLCNSAFACTSLYVGSDLTKDHSTFIARSEDYSNSQNKLFYVSPAGKHTANELYYGCYGFSYRFSHDSYAYTAFSDDKVSGGACPDCGDTHEHTPYEAGGTNEMGVSVSATETLYPDDKLLAADPFNDSGIEEAEITTILLSEADSARAGVELLCSIYDTAGCCGGSGIFIADANEAWYIENMTGHQYIAIKLSKSLAMMEANVSVIGQIDLDDTDNVIASKNVITVAQDAKTFVGNAGQNIIDFRASYAPDQSSNARMNSGLSYLESKTDRTFTAKDYVISNVGKNNDIVPMYNNIQPEKSFTIEDILGFYAIDGIGNARNLETHIFEITDQPSVMNTIEWVAMDDGCFNAFIPYYPMLTTEVYSAYTVSTPLSDFLNERPDLTQRMSYPASRSREVNGERVTENGYCVLPEDWMNSYYWTFDALSNLLRFGGYNDETVTYVKSVLLVLQNDIISQFTALQPAIIGAADLTTASELATQFSSDTAKYVHAYIIEIINALLGGTLLPERGGEGGGEGGGGESGWEGIIDENGMFTDEGLEMAGQITKIIEGFVLDRVDDEYKDVEGYDTEGMTDKATQSILDGVLSAYKSFRDSDIYKSGSGSSGSGSSGSFSADDLRKFFGF